MSAKRDTPSKRNNLGPLDVTQGSGASWYQDSRYQAWYRDSRYQACARSTGIVREAASRIDRKRNEGRMRTKVRIGIRTDLSWKIENNIISNQCFLRRYASEEAFGNTDEFLAVIGNWCYLLA